MLDYVVVYVAFREKCCPSVEISTRFEALSSPHAFCVEEGGRRC